jgi:hypothetical protein
MSLSDALQYDAENLQYVAGFLLWIKRQTVGIFGSILRQFMINRRMSVIWSAPAGEFVGDLVCGGRNAGDDFAQRFDSGIGCRHGFCENEDVASA